MLVDLRNRILVPLYTSAKYELRTVNRSTNVTLRILVAHE